MTSDNFPMCPALKVSPQGQVTIPDNIRKSLRIIPGKSLVDITGIVVCGE